MPELYDPFLPRVIPLIFYYLAIAVFGIFMSVKMGQKYRERKVRPPMFLAIVFVILTIAVFMLAAGLIEAWHDGYFGDLYRITLPFGYSAIIVADVVLLRFTNEILQKGNKLILAVLIIGLAIIVVLWLPMNFWGSSPGPGQVSIRTYSTLALVAYSFIIYIDIISVAGRASHATEDHVMKHGLQLMVVAIFCMIGFFVMLIIDTLLIITNINPAGYSIFVYFAWVFAIVFYISMYLGLVMPPWFKKAIHH
jgi:hypothetical protein